MEEGVKRFNDLRMWQKGIEIVSDIYILTKKFPKEELYGLTSQLRRSAISIPSNIEPKVLGDIIIKNINSFYI